MTSSVQIRPATPADAGDLARILFDAFGGIARAHQFPLDFPVPEATAGMADMLLNHPKFFGVVAEVEGRMIGSNFLDQRGAVAAVGPITIDPAHQSHGVGRTLMQAVIEHGRLAGHSSIRLVQDAFNTTSMSLYASLGFEVKEPLALMTGRPSSHMELNAEINPITHADVADCAALCRAVHGFDRSGELAEAIERFQPVLLRKAGKVVAYMSAPHFWFMNHGVANSNAEMLELLRGIGAARAEPIAMLVPTRNAELFRGCLSARLRMIKPMSLMTLGDYEEPRGASFPSVEY